MLLFLLFSLILETKTAFLCGTFHEKLEFSKQFGATHTINSIENNPIDEIIDLTNGGVDYAFDAIGKKITMNQIFESIKQGGSGADNVGGTSILIGIPESPEITLDSNLTPFFN